MSVLVSGVLCCIKLALLSLVFRNTSDGKASLKWPRTLETTMDTNGFTYDKHTDILVNACTLPYPYGAQLNTMQLEKCTIALHNVTFRPYIYFMNVLFVCPFK